MFVTDVDYPTLDQCIDDARSQSEDLFSLAKLVRGQPPRKKAKTKDLKPIVFVRFNPRLGKAKPVTLKCLMDTGASGSLVAKRHATKLRLKKLDGNKAVWTTPAGNLKTTHKCNSTFVLPEFFRDRVIEWDLHVSDDLGAYDMIIGRDILSALGIRFDFTSMVMEWEQASVPMKDSQAVANEAFHVQDSEAILDATERLKMILDAKYEEADLMEVAKSAANLSAEEQMRLHELLEAHQDLFDGTLGKWNMGAYHIELRPDATPYHARAFPIPKAYTNTLRVEVDRLVETGVLRQVNRSEWAAPTFIIPKKDGSVRFISDFRELNKRIRRKPYPIPKIQDMLLKLEGFQYATSLDLNMGYYHIELSPSSKRLCTIVLPWGKYEYQRLPMGLCNSPDIFQEKWEC